MRVTKTIRTYIEKRVAEAIPEPSLELFSAKKERIDDFSSSLSEYIKAYVKDQLAIFKEENPDLDEWKLRASSYIDSILTIHYDSTNSPEGIRYRTELKAIQAKREEAIEEICVQLELGANKNELEEIIRKAVE